MKTSKRLFVRLPLLIIGLFGAAPSQAANSFQVVYGLLHAHTFFSDGQGTPEEAFKAARDAGLDFFAVTPHNHDEAESDDPKRKDNIQIADNHALYNSPSPITIVRKFKVNNQPKTETLTVKSAKQAAADATDGTFVALYGQEFSTISSGNHVNVFEFNEVIAVGKGRFREFYELLKTDSADPIVQLNHPNVQSDLFYKGSDPKTLKAMFNDYGIDDDDYGPEFSNLVKQTGRFVHLIEVLSGPALSETINPSFRYDPHDEDYHFYLTQGFHVSPTAGQDNHFKTWGRITDARTGVFTKSRSKSDLLGALRANRTFATEDKNVEVSLHLNDEVFMGENTNVLVDTELRFTVKIKDADEPAAAYDVNLYAGNVRPENKSAATDMKPSDGFITKRSRSGNGSIAFPPLLATGSPQFFYVKVVQNSGDRIWTAPIWVNYPKALQPSSQPPPATEEIFLWSSNTSSKVFHKEGCPSVKLIKPENLRTGLVPPTGRTLHNCPITAPEPEPDH